MTMQEAFRNYWDGIFNWQDDAGRQEFWKNFAFWLIIRLIISGGVIAAPSINPAHLMVCDFIFNLLLIPWFALFKRRLNDTGLNGRISTYIVWGLFLLPFLSTYVNILALFNYALLIATLVICSFKSGHFDK